MAGQHLSGLVGCCVCLPAHKKGHALITRGLQQHPCGTTCRAMAALLQQPVVAITTVNISWWMVIGSVCRLNHSAQLQCLL